MNRPPIDTGRPCSQCGEIVNEAGADICDDYEQRHSEMIDIARGLQLAEYEALQQLHDFWTEFGEIIHATGPLLPVTPKSGSATDELMHFKLINRYLQLTDFGHRVLRILNAPRSERWVCDIQRERKEAAA